MAFIIILTKIMLTFIYLTALLFSEIQGSKRYQVYLVIILSILMIWC